MTAALTVNVSSPWLYRAVLSLMLTAATGTAAVVSPEESITPDRARDQSQMVPTNDGLAGSGVTDGLQYSSSDNNGASDDSFGRQVLLKPQERAREFLLTGDASVYFTSNAALTRRDTIDDVFFVADAAFAWTRAINRDVRFQLGGHLSLFRYNDTPSLDFDNIGGGLGLIWTPQSASGIAIFGRYDATKLLHRDGNDLLTDNEFSLGLEKTIVLGRSHFLSLSVGGAVGVTDPHAAQRDLLGAAVAYHLRLARNLDFDVSYRLSGYFYNSGGRDDFNQLASASLTYYFCRWASISAFGSYSLNRSNHSAFDYDVGAAGGGIVLSAQF